MKKFLLGIGFGLVIACAGFQEKAESAQRAARAFECKVKAVEPYFDDVDAARTFVQDVLAQRIDPFRVLAELGVAADEAAALGARFKACSPSAEALKAPAPEPGRELAAQ